MQMDIFLSPTEEADPVTPDVILAQISQSGIVCQIREYQDGVWVLFGGRKSDLNLSVEDDGHVSSAILQSSMQDDIAFTDQLLGVFRSMGWSYEDAVF